MRIQLGKLQKANWGVLHGVREASKFKPRGCIESKEGPVPMSFLAKINLGCIKTTTSPGPEGDKEVL